MKSEQDRHADEPQVIKFLFKQRLPFRVSADMMPEIFNQSRWFFNCGRYVPNKMVIDKLAVYMEVKITQKEGGLEWIFEENDLKKTSIMKTVIEWNEYPATRPMREDFFLVVCKGSVFEARWSVGSQQWYSKCYDMTVNGVTHWVDLPKGIAL